MINSCSRLTQCALFVLAIAGTRQSFSQAIAAADSSPTVVAAVEASPALPDAPPFRSQQQPAAALQQQSSAPPPNETESQRKAREHDEAERQVKQEEKQRIGGVVPNFNVVINGKAVPLTWKQKFDISLHTIIDPYTFALAAFIGGGYGELTDDHTGYAHGPEGFFKRVAASYADNVSGNVIGNALLPSILHQDPRYFRKAEGTKLSRVIYSAMTTFICRGDNGKRQFNYSNVAGNFISGAISNAYYPSDERGVGLTITNATVVTLEGMLGAQLLEFSPDVSAYVHRRREHHRLVMRQQADAAAAARSGAPSTPPAQP